MTSHHPITMNRTSTGARELETFAMANCLMLLNNQASTIPTRGRTTDDESTWFPCKTCGRKFPSFQALGGHRASHKKIKSSFSDDEKEKLKLISLTEKPKTHVCTICGAQFPIGQALGGHMRRHRQTPVSGGGGGSTLTTENSELSGGGDHHDSNEHKKRKLDEQVIVLVPNLKKSSSGKRVCLDKLDLNLYLWNDKCDENDGNGVDEGEVVEVVDEEMDFLKLELRQPIN